MTHENMSPREKGNTGEDENQTQKIGATIKRDGRVTPRSKSKRDREEKREMGGGGKIGHDDRARPNHSH